MMLCGTHYKFLVNAVESLDNLTRTSFPLGELKTCSACEKSRKASQKPHIQSYNIYI